MRRVILIGLLMFVGLLQAQAWEYKWDSAKVKVTPQKVRVFADWIPGAGGTYLLGKPDTTWKKAYIDSIFADFMFGAAGKADSLWNKGAYLSGDLFLRDDVTDTLISGGDTMITFFHGGGITSNIYSKAFATEYAGCFRGNVLLPGDSSYILLKRDSLSRDLLGWTYYWCNITLAGKSNADTCTLSVSPCGMRFAKGSSECWIYFVDLPDYPAPFLFIDGAYLAAAGLYGVNCNSGLDLSLSDANYIFNSPSLEPIVIGSPVLINATQQGSYVTDTTRGWKIDSMFIRGRKPGSKIYADSLGTGVLTINAGRIQHNSSLSGWSIGTSTPDRAGCVYVGDGAGESNTGGYPTQIGYHAGDSNHGDHPTQVGYFAGYNNNAGGVTQVGYQAGANNTGLGAAQVGYQAGYSNTGNYAAQFGYLAGKNNEGVGVVQVGYHAGNNNTTDFATQLGYQAGQNNSGAKSTQVGYWAGYYNTGSDATQVGYHAGERNSGANVIQAGSYAGYRNGGSRATQVGYAAGDSNIADNSTQIGAYAGKKNRGVYSTQIGNWAGHCNTGDYPAHLGAYAGYYNNGAKNTAVGDSASFCNDGMKNTALGAEAFNAFTLDKSKEKTFNYNHINVSNEKVYIPHHALGAIGTYLNVLFTQGTAPITGLTDNTRYQIEVVHTDSIQFKDVNITNAGNGTGHKITPQNVFHNATAVGYNAEPFKSNQVVLGDSHVVEVWTAGVLAGTPALRNAGYFSPTSTVDTVVISGATANDFYFLQWRGSSIPVYTLTYTAKTDTLFVYCHTADTVKARSEGYNWLRVR